MFENKFVSLPSHLKTIEPMARPIREKSGTGVYHVMLRGINRQDIFAIMGSVLLITYQGK